MQGGARRAPERGSRVKLECRVGLGGHLERWFKVWDLNRVQGGAGRHFGRCFRVSNRFSNYVLDGPKVRAATMLSASCLHIMSRAQILVSGVSCSVE